MKDTKGKLLFLPGSSYAPADRFRILQFVPYLEERGHAVTLKYPYPNNYWQSKLPRCSALQKTLFWSVVHSASFLRKIRQTLLATQSSKYDSVFLNRHLVPDPTSLISEIKLIKSSKRLIYDLDDAIFHGSYKNKTDYLIKSASHVTVGNKYLYEYAANLNENVTIIPTVIDTNLYQVKDYGTFERLKIGWIGSSQTLKTCLPAVKDIFVKLNTVMDYEFIYICDKKLGTEWSGILKNVKHIKWDKENEIRDMQQFDIGIMPLFDTPFQRGKCGAKLIQYMGVGIPTIASPVGANCDICVNGETGFLPRNIDEWIDAFLFFSHYHEKLALMGAKARLRAESCYSITSVLNTIENILLNRYMTV